MPMNFNLSPFSRVLVGLDNFEHFFGRVGQMIDDSSGYPPYDIEQYGDDFKIVMAVAGFGEKDIGVTLTDNTLTVEGSNERKSTASKTVSSAPPSLLYNGIARRSFRRRFELAENIKVSSVMLEDGILTISMYRYHVESEKPVVIPVNGGDQRIKSKGTCGNTKPHECVCETGDAPSPK